MNTIEKKSHADNDASSNDIALVVFMVTLFLGFMLAMGLDKTNPIFETIAICAFISSMACGVAGVSELFIDADDRQLEWIELLFLGSVSIGTLQFFVGELPSFLIPYVCVFCFSAILWLIIKSIQVLGFFNFLKAFFIGFFIIVTVSAILDSIDKR